MSYQASFEEQVKATIPRLPTRCDRKACRASSGSQLPSQTMFHVPAETAATRASPATSAPPATTQESSGLKVDSLAHVRRPPPNPRASMVTASLDARLMAP